MEIKYIPENIDVLRGVSTARQWEKAAYTHAFIGKDKPFATVAEFVAQKITGLSAAHTVKAYWQKWEDAITSGDAIPVKPGSPFIQPTLAWQMESDATRANRVGDVDAYALAAEEEGTTTGMAIRTGSSVPALKAAIKADPKVAEAAREALRESFDERRQALIEANKAATGKGGGTISDPYIPTSEQPTPPQPKAASPIAFIRMLKIERDLRQLQEFLENYTFTDDDVRTGTVKLLDQFTGTVAACKSLILDGSVSSQAEDFLKALS